MPPVIEDFIVVSDNAYGRKDVVKMEMDILKTVRFDLGVPLSYTFLRRYAKCIRADMKFLTLARYILELSLQDYSFAPERDSFKACASLFLAMKMAVAYETHHANTKHSGTNEVPMYVSTSNLTSTEWVRNAFIYHAHIFWYLTNCSPKERHSSPLHEHVRLRFHSSRAIDEQSS